MKKNLLLLVSSLLLVMVIGLNVSFASENDIKLDVDMENVYGECYVLDDKESITPQSLLNINLNVTKYSQGDSRWSGDYMETEHLTIGRAGCALTSTAMAVDYLGISTDPGIFNQDMGNYACPIYWYEVPDRGAHGTVDLDTYIASPSYSEFYSTARTALEYGRPIILGYNKTTGGTHFVLVKSVLGYGNSMSDYTCIDPNGGYERNLDDVLQASSSLYRLVVYK